MNLTSLGWNEHFQQHYEIYKKDKGCTIGRINAEHKNIYRLYTEAGEVLGEISGKFHYQTTDQQDYPAVGDWVVINMRPEENRATIHAVLPRKSKFSRKTAGINTKEQIAATNIDIVFIVTSLNHQFNLRRLERYLIMAWESGAKPVILLSKADLCDYAEDRRCEVTAIAPGVPVHAVSSLSGEGVDSIRSYLSVGKTAALLGPSGVGKSTLINYLLGKEVQQVQDISSYEDKGRHTSTYRELFVLPEGGIIIDTPGMRELQLWDCDTGLSETFADITSLEENCKFSNCTHGGEPGCAVKAALITGELEPERYTNYKKLQKELAFLEKRQKNLNKVIEKRTTKSLKRQVRENSLRDSY